MIHVGIIGFGYWGPNIVRNFNLTDGAVVSSICDRDGTARKKAEKLYPHIKVISDWRQLISDPHIDAIAVVTPVNTHYELAKQALEQGKHIFVEKPFTQTSAQAEELIELAERKNLIIMVDHTFIYTGAVRKIKELIDSKALGNLYYFDSIRVNLGLFQHDVNVVWDLAPHDLAIMDCLIEEKPKAVTAVGKGHVNGHEDIAFITIHFENNMIAHFNVNWLSPVKIRLMLIGGDKKMLVWNDVDANEKVKVYDKGVDVKGRESIYDMLISYRAGDMWMPKINNREALDLEIETFIKCVEENKKPFNDGHSGLRVVKILEACDKSMQNKGEMTMI